MNLTPEECRKLAAKGTANCDQFRSMMADWLRNEIERAETEPARQVGLRCFVQVGTSGNVWLIRTMPDELFQVFIYFAQLGLQITATDIAAQAMEAEA